MRNVDKIKRLNHELGRYQKKVLDQAKELEALRRSLEAANHGSQETQMLVDALLTCITLAYGEEAKDPDNGEQIGHRLTVPVFSVEEVRSKYEIHARRDEKNGTYILGVIERGQADGQDSA